MPSACVPGESGLAQVRLEEPLAPRYDDRFIVRSYSPVYTIGGGVVLDALPPRRTRSEAARARAARGAAGTRPVERRGGAARLARPADDARPRSPPRSACRAPQVADELNRAKLERLKVGGETCFVTPEALDALVAAIERELLAFHAENPKATGIATSALRDRVDRRLDPAVVRRGARRRRSHAGVAAVEAGQARHPKAAVSRAGRRAGRRRCAAAAARARKGLRRETVAELAAETGIDVGIARKVLGRLASEGRVVRISSELHFSAEAIAASEAIADRVPAAHPEGATAAELRDALGVSRKYAIPLLEYFDAQGLTRREGDVRVLRRA